MILSYKSLVRAVYVIVMCLSSLALLQGQKFSFPDRPTAEEMNDWLDLLFQVDPNVFQIDQAIRDWYAIHPFQKTTYTQFYKKWRRHVAPFIHANGFVRYPDESSIQQDRIAYNQKWAANHAGSGRSVASWASIGPFQMINDAVNGDQVPVSWQTNIYSFDQSKSNPDILYCGTEGSEIYKSMDRGKHWQPASRNLSIQAVLTVEIDPINPDIVYAGDNNGIFKTLDGGANWIPLLTVSQMGVNDIAIHPTNPAIVLVASGKGLWRSTDGGNNWVKIYGEKCFDLEWKPDDPNTVFLLKDDSADQRCTFWRSNNAGATFAIQTGNGWFDGTNPARSDGGGRMTVTPAQPDRIFVVLIGQAKDGDNGFIGVYRSDNAGSSWTLPNPPAGGPYSQNHPNLAVISPFDGTGFHQGYYNLSIGVSHTDPDELLVGHLSLWRSSNGGSSYLRIGGYGGSLQWMHPDVQEIKCLGGDTWVCTDGGINYSQNNFSTHNSRTFGISGSDYWGFGQGWNEDILVGGRYHNGNSGWYETYPDSIHIRLGGGEAPTGYVSPGGGRKAYFSDIGGKVLPASIDQASVGFPISKSPNELYFAAESSEQVWAPDCYNHYYLGKDNQLWKTEDGGSFFELIHAFDQTEGGNVTQIALCRAQPEVMVVAQRNENTWSEGWVWRTSDGGQTWSALSLPTGYKRRFLLSISGTDPNLMWLGYTDGANGEKVFESTDGGVNWSNISSTLFDGEAPTCLVHVLGTDGALFLGTNRSVYYRPEPGADWEMFSDGLPKQINCNILRPFYRDKKLRLGAYGKGMWETPLPDEFKTLCQPMVDKRIAFCERDTFQFDDYSVMAHENASWAWTFEGGTPATADIRNPRVVFPGNGTYKATLTVTDGTGATASRDLAVQVQSECQPDTIPGYALRTTTDGDAAIMPDQPGEPYDELTISAWVKPDGGQVSYAGIVIGAYNDNAFGLNVRDNNMLGYHWPGGAWSWNSGFTLISDEWQHVALVMKSGSITLYLNGIGNTHETNVIPVKLDGVSIGRYRDWASRTWKGAIDEVAIWDRALTQDEIRETMHLTKRIEEQPDLIAYYQFNRETGEETDRVGVRHLQFAGGAYREVANGPWGGGVSSRQNIDQGGTYDFGNTGVSMKFPDQSTYPDGEIVVSRIHLAPDVLPDLDNPVSPHYWIVNNYGQVFFDPMTSLELDRVGAVSPANVTDPTTLELHLRTWNGEGDNWMNWANAIGATPGQDGGATFASIQDLGQWMVVNTGEITAVKDPDAPGTALSKHALLYPNPLHAGSTVHIRTDLQGPLGLRIWNGEGVVLIRERDVQHDWSTRLAGPSGTYFYEVTSADKMIRGAIQIIE
ncbi:MAG: hypothetical protein K9I85_04975 [Saprospiraceae bacterium]|nr:hypothetical protein [Saprospiraceae bacterium]